MFEVLLRGLLEVVLGGLVEGIFTIAWRHRWLSLVAVGGGVTMAVIGAM